LSKPKTGPSRVRVPPIPGSLNRGKRGRELPFAEAVKALAPAQASLRREVNPTVMKSAEFLRKRRAKNGFVAAVWKAPRLWVIGSDHELG